MNDSGKENEEFQALESAEDIKIHLIETLIRANCPLSAEQYGSLIIDDYCELTDRQSEAYDDAFVVLN